MTSKAAGPQMPPKSGADIEWVRKTLKAFYLMGYEDRQATKDEAEEHAEIQSSIIDILLKDEAKEPELVFLGPLPGESVASALAVNAKVLGLEK